MLNDTSTLPKDGYQLQEYKAIHEDNFLSGWLREDVEGKEKMERRIDEDKQEESQSGKKRWREEEKGSKSKECA